MTSRRLATAASIRCGDVSTQLPDKVLIRAIADRDNEAFAELYRRHHDYVLRVVMRHVNSAAVAEEVANDVFIDVWRTARQYAAKSQVTTWLMGIARHRAISACRRRGEDALDERAAAAIEDPGDDGLKRVETRERSDILQRCLARLPKAQRCVIDLVYYQDKSVDEAARCIGIPPATVRTRMFYARNRMAELLQNQGIDRSYI
jgi:RNA polymerase sigma-70 factor (ECF subfamily)